MIASAGEKLLVQVSTCVSQLLIHAFCNFVSALVWCMCNCLHSLGCLVRLNLLAYCAVPVVLFLCCSLASILPVLEKVVQVQRPLVIVAEDVESEVGEAGMWCSLLCWW